MRSKYESNVLPYLEKINLWVKNGATAKEIATKLHVAYSTFRKYLDWGEKGDERYEALSAAFVQACEEPDDAVEAALFKRACGIEYEEVKVEETINRKTGAIETLTTKTKKLIPPDPTSAMFWLTNRKATNWRYKPEPAAEPDAGGSGIVVLAPVMEHPGGPDGEAGAGDG